MADIPQDLRYLATHEWARRQDDGSIVVGISDHAQDMLGDVVFVELPEVGRVVAAGEELAVVESVKAASDIYAPLAGEVVEVNSLLDDAPETVNQEPYGAGWFLRLRPADPAGFDGLLDADGYAAVIAQQD